MEENKYKCDICKKYYKSYQSLWHHKKRYHTIITQNNSNQPQDNSFRPQNNSIKPQDNSIKSQDELIPSYDTFDKLTCEYCSKIYSRMDNLNRHKKTCKVKDTLKKENEELKVKIKQQEIQILEIAELKKMVADLINSKTNGSNYNSNITNNSNNTTNNNNGTINNNYITIVPFTKENFVEVSTEEEHLLILKQKGHNAIYKCIELKHFNEKYPQFHNFMIPNKRTNEALVYDGNIKDFKLEKKETAVDEVITYAECDIEDIYALHENKINNEQKTNIKKLITDTSPNPKHVEDHVETMGYDYRNMIKNTYKKTRKQQQYLE
jgi:hypothetical protein